MLSGKLKKVHVQRLITVKLCIIVYHSKVNTVREERRMIMRDPQRNPIVSYETPPIAFPIVLPRQNTEMYILEIALYVLRLSSIPWFL